MRRFRTGRTVMRAVPDRLWTTCSDQLECCSAGRTLCCLRFVLAGDCLSTQKMGSSFKKHWLSVENHSIAIRLLRCACGSSAPSCMARSRPPSRDGVSLAQSGVAHVPSDSAGTLFTLKVGGTMRYITPFMVVALLGLTSGPGIAADQTNTKDAQKSGGLGLTNRPSAGGGMGEDTTPAGSAEGPRALPPGRAPGYEGADKGRTTTPRVGSQRDFSPPAGPPEDPVPRAGSGR